MSASPDELRARTERNIKRFNIPKGMDSASPDTPREPRIEHDIHGRPFERVFLTPVDDDPVSEHGARQWTDIEWMHRMAERHGYFLVRDGEAVHQGKVHRLEAMGEATTYVQIQTERAVMRVAREGTTTLWRLVEETQPKSYETENE